MEARGGAGRLGWSQTEVGLRRRISSELVEVIQSSCPQCGRADRRLPSRRLMRGSERSPRPHRLHTTATRRVLTVDRRRVLRKQKIKPCMNGRTGFWGIFFRFSNWIVHLVCIWRRPRLARRPAWRGRDLKHQNLGCECTFAGTRRVLPCIASALCPTTSIRRTYILNPR